MTSHTPSLEAERLTFAISDIVRIGPIDLEVAPGATLGIVGETGSGKSLLCRTLVGMLALSGGRIESGTLRIQGEDYARADRAQWAQLRRRRVGYMPQASMSSLNPVRRIGAQLHEIMGGDSRARRARAIELMERVQMRDPARVLRSYPHELSGGMRQRVMLAMSLVGDPELLVADEPTTALDATVQSEVLSLISGIQSERGMAVILVSHDMRVIRRSCDSIAVMYGGRIVERGPLGSILQSPSHPYTRALLKADPALSARKTLLGAIEGSPRPPSEWNDGGCSFRDRCAFASEMCAIEDPALRAVHGAVQAACHHAEAVRAA